MATPEYIKNANNTYNAKFDIVQVKLDKGTKERIKAHTNESFNQYIKRLIMTDLDRLEGLNAQQAETIAEPQETPQRAAERPELDKYKGMTAEELQSKLMAARANNEITKAAERQRTVDRIAAENWNIENGGHQTDGVENVDFADEIQ